MSAHSPDLRAATLAALERTIRNDNEPAREVRLTGAVLLRHFAAQDALALARERHDLAVKRFAAGSGGADVPSAAPTLTDAQADAIDFASPPLAVAAYRLGYWRGYNRSPYDSEHPPYGNAAGCSEARAQIARLKAIWPLRDLESGGADVPSASGAHPPPVPCIDRPHG